MDVESILKVDMTLRKLAAIAFAVNLWELQDVKKKIYKFRQFEMYDTALSEGYSDKKARDQWKDLVIMNVEEAVDSLGLPAALIEDIKCHVFEIGGMIFDFVLYLSKISSEVDFGSKIHWASYGRIDVVRMVKEWSEGSCGDHFLDYRFLRLGSIYSQEDFVRLCTIKNITEVNEILSTSSPKDMLRFCLSNEDLVFEARHFWHQLDELEKKDIVYECVEKCLTSSSEEKTMMRYIRQVRTDLLLFFLSQMSNVQRLKFLTEHRLPLFKTFLETWPHQELCVNILDNFEDFGFSDCDLDILCPSVFGYLPTPTCFDNDDISLFRNDDNECVIKYKNYNVFHDILQKLFEKIPKEVKLRYFTKRSFVKFLHSSFDYRTLSIIFNDVDVKQIKHEKLFGIKFEKNFEDLFDVVFWQDYFIRMTFDFLQNYMKYVLSDEKEIEIFRKKLNWVSKFACKGDIVVADNLLNLLYPTKSERDEVKKKVSVIFVASFVMEKRFETADDFLKWRLDTEEERKNVKKMLFALDTTEPAEYCRDFVRNRDCWGPMNDYLTWRFESEEERKKTKEEAFSLEMPDFIEHCKHLIDEKDFYRADKYLKWRYGEDDEERKNMKKKMYALETMDPTEFCNDLIKNEEFEEAIEYLKWRFESEEERKHFKKTLYKSDEWLREKCCKILFPTDPAKINRFLCSKLLELCLESEEEVKEFRRYKLLNKEIIVKYLKENSVEISDNFARFCYRRPEDVEEIIRLVVAKNESESNEKYE